MRQCIMAAMQRRTPVRWIAYSMITAQSLVPVLSARSSGLSPLQKVDENPTDGLRVCDLKKNKIKQWKNPRSYDMEEKKRKKINKEGIRGKRSEVLEV